MMKLLFFLVVPFLSACSSGPTQESSKLEGNLEVKRITLPVNERFTPFYEVANEDYSFLQESIQSFYAEGNQLKKLKSSDSLGQALLGCYLDKIDESLGKLAAMFSALEKNADYWNGIGICFYLKNKPRMALLYFNKALDLDNKYSPAYNNIGHIYYKEGKYSKAMAAFQESIKQNRFSKTPRVNLALIFINYHHLDKAADILMPLSRQYPKDSFLNLLLGNLFTLKGSYEEAARYFSLADFIFSTQDRLHYALALLQLNQKSLATKVFKIREKRNQNSSYLKQLEKHLESQL